MKRELFGNVSVVPYAPGAVIDRMGYLSALLGVDLPAPTGSPTAAVLTVTATHADAEGGTYELVDDERLFPTGGKLNVLKGLTASVAIDLIGCKRFVKLAAAVTFEGGTSPAAAGTYALALGDPRGGPVQE